MRNYQCNVYEVKVTIGQIGGYHPGEENPEYTKQANVLAISEEAAVNKLERALKWELRDLLKNAGGFAVSHECKILIENVVY